MLKHFLSMAAVAILAAGCGPEKSQLDLEREQAEARLAQKNSEFSSIEGTYEGFVSDQGVNLIKLRLTLVKVIEPISPNSQEWVPKLIGKSRMTLVGSSNEMEAVYFQSILYNSANGALLMVGSVDSAGAKSIPYNVQAQLVGDTILGKYIPPRDFMVDTPQGKKFVSSADISLTRVDTQR